MVKNLNIGEIPIHEPGLYELLKEMKKSKKLTFLSESSNREINVFIICVGTPVDCEGKADLHSLKEVLEGGTTL